MEKMNFSVSINATNEKVWDVLWSDASYKQWTSAFAEGSHAVTDNWKQGTKVLFLDAKGSGMVSTVTENKPNAYMAFTHLGELKNGIEDTATEGVKQWSGATENYTLAKTANGIDLTIAMEGAIPDEFKNYLLKAWPEALEKVKRTG